MTADRTTARVHATAAALFIAYAIWGSLFPFDFHAVPWRDAVASFWEPWTVPVSRWSVSDFVSNVLLFVPIGLFAMGALDRRAGAERGVRGLSQGGRTAGTADAFALQRVAIALAGSIVLSTSIELAQAFVSWRTPSVVDVGAETLGAACGVAMWAIAGQALDRAVMAATSIVGRSPVAERLLLAYCAIFAAAWLVPADFTLRPNEIADKYMHKRLLLPFMPSPDATRARDLTMIGAAAMPIGVTATLCGCGGIARRSLPSATLIATTFLAGLEAAQVFVFSRTTDARALIVAAATAAVAAAVVVAAGRRPLAAAG